MQTPDPTETVYQAQGNLWLVAGIPALLIIAYLIYSAVKQTGGSASTDAGAGTTSTTGDEDGK